MENTSNKALGTREVSYYRQRYKNRIFSEIVTFFARESERTGLTKRDLAARLQRDPGLITRWLSAPSNLTLETISDLLLAMGAEMDSRIVSFSERPIRNFSHELIERIGAAEAQKVIVKPRLVASEKIRVSHINAYESLPNVSASFAGTKFTSSHKIKELADAS